MIINQEDHCLLVVLEKEQRLLETLTRELTQHGLKGGIISAIGALKEVELGYYDLEHQTYLRKTFAGEDFELLSLHGNLGVKDNAPYIHAHVSLGRQDFSTIGGHLFEAIVAVTVEIAVTPLKSAPRRAMDQAIGLALYCGL